MTHKKKKPLGLLELVAIAIGGMIGGGVFSVLGVSVNMIGNATPLAFALGGALALAAAYSYAKLSSYYKDEGATYSFFQRTFPQQKTAASIVGWLIGFGYISTIALYAYTFSSYFSSMLPHSAYAIAHKLIAGAVILIFTLINIFSVRGMGKVEDALVYTKVLVLLLISLFFLKNGHIQNVIPILPKDFSFFSLITVASLTFVAFEGFQLVIHAYKEVESPEKNVPHAIYYSVLGVSFIYVLLALSSMSALPKEDIIKGKEFALAAGATSIIGDFGYYLVISGALLATASAISGTLFGASRLLAVIAKDGYFPNFLSLKNKKGIPAPAIITMAALAYIFLLVGGLETILEFGSITFIMVSFLMSYANFRIRAKTKTHPTLAVLTMALLSSSLLSILFYESKKDPWQIISIFIVYILLSLFAILYSQLQKNKKSQKTK